MREIRGIQLIPGSSEEQLPDFLPDFPYIATRVEMDRYAEPEVPWHWHGAVELFYMESGCLEYTTPNGKRVFPAGSGGFVNADVLHASRLVPSGEPTVQLLHLFDPALLGGESGSRMEEKYVRPLTAAPGLELLPLYPEDPRQRALLEKIRNAFSLPETEFGHEVRLLSQLGEIWLELLALACPPAGKPRREPEGEGKLKTMLRYIQQHYSEELSAEDLARSAHVSRRVCFRLFQEKLHTTPNAYLRSFRLRKACRMLTATGESITQIAYACGLGSASYFGKVFRERFGCTPAEYRKKWHDCDNLLHK